MNPVQNIYDEGVQYEWMRLERHRTEFAVTLRALAEYAPRPPASILDIGGGPGRYAIELARRGYAVTLLDLSSACLGLAKEKAREAGVELVDYVHGTATDLGRFPDARFEAALLLGPLYHLQTKELRQCAVQAARRVLRPGGVIFAAVVTRYAPIRDAAIHEPTWLLEHPEEYENLLADGFPAKQPGSTWFENAYFAQPTEFAPFMQAEGFETRALVACEGVVSMIDQQLNQLSGKLWEAWVDLNYRFGHDPSVYGMAEHLLYVGQA